MRFFRYQEMTLPVIRDEFTVLLCKGGSGEGTSTVPSLIVNRFFCFCENLSFFPAESGKSVSGNYQSLIPRNPVVKGYYIPYYFPDP